MQDATAAKFDLGADAVPDDALAFLGKYNQYWWKRRSVNSHYEIVESTESAKFVEPNGAWEYVQSSDRSAYPDSGTLGDYEYQYLGQPFAPDNLLGGTKVEIGSYVGTGTYGASNPNSLTFDFEPKILVVSEIGKYIWQMFKLDNSGEFKNGVSISAEASASTSGSVSREMFCKFNGGNVMWYCNRDSAAQLNWAGVKYRYITIGQRRNGL